MAGVCTKSQNKKERHTNLLHTFLVTQSLHEEIRPEEAVELKSLYSRFNEEWKVMKKQKKKKINNNNNKIKNKEKEKSILRV